MIDTIRFKIKISESEYQKIVKKSKEFTFRDVNTDTTIFKFHKTEVPIGSFDRSINFTVFEDNKEYIFLEFSVPKFQLNTNIFLIYCSQAKQAVKKMEVLLTEYFGQFPPCETWEIYRLDVCYAWKFQTEGIAETVISILKTYNFPRLEKTLYPTSIHWAGSIHTVKFYQKHEEFYKHDFKKFIKTNVEYGYNMLDFSKGVVRFEVSLKKKGLYSAFGTKHLFLEDLRDSDIYTILQNYLMKILKSENREFMTSEEVHQKLKDKYTKKEAYNLWVFYQLDHSPDPEVRKKLIQENDRRTLWYNRKRISKAGVGLPIKDIEQDFNFTIPSEYVVNEDTADVPKGTQLSIKNLAGGSNTS